MKLQTLILIYGLTLLLSCGATSHKQGGAPELSEVNLMNVEQGDSVFSFDVNDRHTGSDFDRSGYSITYSCFYDTKIDYEVHSDDSCSDLEGFSIEPETGVITVVISEALYAKVGPKNQIELNIVASSPKGLSTALYTLKLAERADLIEN